MQPLPPVGVEVGFRVGRSRQFRLESESKLDPESAVFPGVGIGIDKI